MSLPLDFLNRMKDYLGDDYSEFLCAYNRKPYKAFRVNTEKKCTFDLTQFATGEVPYAKNAYYTENEKIGSSPLHHAGAYYMQEPSAMLPVEVLAPQEGDRVLDLCAAPGGKSGQIAAKIGNGTLISNEINQSRSRVLLGNIERLGFSNVIVTSLAPAELSKHISEWADKVLVDAPCSGEGMFRKSPEACLEWSLKSVDACAKRQLEILKEGGKCLKCGGILVYSTCTFSKEENEFVIEKFIQEEDFELLEINNEYTEKGYDKNHFTARVYPHKQNGEGHFIAKLKKISSNAIISDKQKPFYRDLNKKENALLRDFAKENLKQTPNAYVFGNKLFIPPSNIPSLPYGIIGCGVKIGDIDQRIIPHHQLFSAKISLFQNVLNLQLQDERIPKYIFGEEVNANLPSGYAVLAVEGCALGGIKVSNERGKNHYPKGLRKKL